MSANSFAGPVSQAVPRYSPDLRPSADAAATRRQDRAAAGMAIAAVEPPSATQAAAVSRSMATTVSPVGQTEGIMASQAEQTHRTLKPYGVAMLPRTEATEEREDHQIADDTAETDEAALG